MRLLADESFPLKLPSPTGVVYFRLEPSTPEEPADHLLRLLAVKGVSLEGRLTVIGARQVRQRPFAS